MKFLGMKLLYWHGPSSVPSVAMKVAAVMEMLSA